MRDIPVQYAGAPTGRTTGATKYAVVTDVRHVDGTHQMIKPSMDASFFWSSVDMAERRAAELIEDGWGVASIIRIESGCIEVVREFAQPKTITRTADHPGDYEDGGSW